MSPIAYDVKTAAAVTGLSQSFIKRLLDSGELKGKRTHVGKDGELAGKWLIKPADLERYVESLPDGA